ncbi:MAG TPA: hypothetical protein VGH19_16055 [Verrucomicrobiae bacterium]
MTKELPLKRANKSEPFFRMELVPAAKKAIWRANTGHKIRDDDLIDTQAAREKLKRQTETIVDRLAMVWHETKGRWGAKLRIHSDLTMVCSVENVSRPLPGFAHQVFLPIMAHDSRAALIKEFQLWMERHQYTRYYVVTTGERCGIGELKDRFQWLHEQISEFRRWLRTMPEYHGIEVVLRCDEFTIRRESNGILSFHPHTNLAIHFPRLIGGRNLDKEERSAAFLQFKARVDAFFGTHVKDNGLIRNQRELIKYICKYEKDASGDGTIGLLDVTPYELAEIYSVRRGLKPVQTLGDFKKFRGGLRRDRKKVVSKWFEKLGQFKLTTYDQGPVKKKEVVEDLLPNRREIAHKNQLVAITDPSPWHDVVARPAVIIRNFDGNYQGLRDSLKLGVLRDFVKTICEQRAISRATKDGSSASSYWVHTFTETPEGFFDPDPSGCAWDDMPPPEMVEEWADNHLMNGKI